METYVVRVWTSGGADAPRGEVRGFIEQVGEGAKHPFVGVEQLLARLGIDAMPSVSEDLDADLRRASLASAPTGEEER